MNDKKRIVIAEDHQLFREGLRAIIESSNHFKVVGEASDGVEANRSIWETQPDLILLDISMLHMNGISVINEVRGKFPDLKILVLTMYESDHFILDAFKAGANGVCLKDSTRKTLLTAIEEVMEGKTYISPTMAGEVIKAYIAEERGAETKGLWKTVSQREREVLKLVAEGHMNREIASILNISIKTVKKHRSNIMKKTNLHNVAGLTAFAIEKGLIPRSN